MSVGVTEGPPAVAWAAGSVALAGQARSGDLHVVHQREDGVLLAAVDGLGHGEIAAQASEAAVATLLEETSSDPATLIGRCDAALRGTRGAAMSIAFVGADPPAVAWAGIGNVEAVLVRADRSPGASILLRGGVVGGGSVEAYGSEHPLSVGDTLAMATDGIHPGFRDDVDPRRDLEELVRSILASRARATDDALILVSRYLGR